MPKTTPIRPLPSPADRGWPVLPAGIGRVGVRAPGALLVVEEDDGRPAELSAAEWAAAELRRYCRPMPEEAPKRRRGRAA